MNKERNLAYTNDKELLELAKESLLSTIRFDIEKSLKKYDSEFKYNKMKYTDYKKIDENSYKINLKIRKKEEYKCSFSYYSENIEHTIEMYLDKILEILRDIDSFEFTDDIDIDLIHLYCVITFREKEKITEFEYFISDEYDIYEQYIQAIKDTQNFLYYFNRA